MTTKTYTKDEAAVASLTPNQFAVTQQDATEPPFTGDFWENPQDAFCVDVFWGEPLFSSTDKFESGSGWPSFTKPVDKEFVVDKRDFSHLMLRTEVRSKHGD